MVYYPTVTMVLWAFVTLYLAPTNHFLRDAPGFFIGAVLLWDVLFRGQLGVSLCFHPATTGCRHCFTSTRPSTGATDTW